MSHPLYEKYISDMKRLKATPPYMSEAQVLESLGIKIEEEYVAPLQILPKKKAVIKQSLTTDDHFPEVGKKVEAKKPKAVRKPLTKDQKDKKNEKRREARAEVRAKTPPKRMSLAGMTADQIRLRRNAQQRARKELKKAQGWKEPLKTAEQRAANREYSKQYHQEKKTDPEYKARRRAASRKYCQKMKKYQDPTS